MGLTFDLWTLTWGLLAATAVVWGGLFLWDWRRHGATSPPSRPVSLLQELAASHKLSADELRQLHLLMQVLHLADPVRLFVDPRCLEELAGKPNGHQPAAAKLGQRLFGDEFRVAS